MFNCRLLIFIIYWFVQGITTNAQAPFFKNIIFDREKKEAKLLKIFQDKKGYIWLGTSVGICRYDGINFKYLEKDNNQVTAITESNDGVLWIGHLNGEIAYVENNTVKKFSPPEGLPKIKISGITFDQDNRLWFSTYGEGIYCYEKQILYNINHDDGLTDDNIYDILADGDKIWAGTDNGISICSFKNEKKIIKVIDKTNGLPDNIVRNMKKDDAGNIWMAMQDNGVCYYDRVLGKAIVPPELANWQYGQANDVLPLNKEVFIGTEDHGIIEIHFGLPNTNKMLPAKKRKINAVHQLMLDKNEQVWMVADNTLSMANSNRFQLLEIPAEWQDEIKAITSDTAGSIWFSNAKGLFVKKNNNTPIQKVILPANIHYASIVCLHADDESNIYIGAYNNGLYHYNSITRQLKQYTSLNGLCDDNVFSIAGTSNEIWMATLAGVSKMDFSSGSPVFFNYSKANGLSNNYIYNVFIDSRGNKWFATDGSGISKLADGVFYNYDNIPGLDKNIVYTITEDIFGRIWFIGRNSGLFAFDGKYFKRYGIKDGLHDNDILNVVADKNGNLLLTHPDGLEIFHIKKENFTFYGAESGFDNINPQINAYCTTAKKAILIGAADKIIQYYPAAEKYNQFPGLVMNSVGIFFNPIDMAKKKYFNYDENHLTFDYAGLWYADPGAISYQYQLEGYGNDWINTKDHVVTFPNLPPGKYTFHLKTSINNDFRQSPQLSYSFNISTAFWKTAWFRILALLLAGYITYYFVNTRIRLIQFRQEKEKQKLVSQLEVLKNQLNPHFLFNSFNTLMNIIDKDKQMAMDFTEKLSDFYREILLLQDKEMVSVQEEINLLKNYVYLQQKRFGNNFKLVLNVSEDHLRMYVPPLTLQLLAENALKHNFADEKNLLVIKIESAQSFLIVSNNITAPDTKVRSAGIGIKNIQQRVQLLTGMEIKIIATDKEFNVIIPIKK
ncbi:MAG: two-component regulator propeller domain-containing protein [Ferruginibacter sp.]